MCSWHGRGGGGVDPPDPAAGTELMLAMGPEVRGGKVMESQNIVPCPAMGGGL